ASNSIASG
nr:Chain B, endogenous peptide [synthetic construct]